MSIEIKRIYDQTDAGDGKRILGPAVAQRDDEGKGGPLPLDEGYSPQPGSSGLVRRRSEKVR